MLRDILRFNREAPQLLRGEGEELALGDDLERNRYGRLFRDDYILPMGAAIWSTDPARMLAFPARFFVRFFMNHGLLSLDDRPQWRVIRGGSRTYVELLVAPFRDRIRLRSPVRRIRRDGTGVYLDTDQGCARFDAVFLACHSDEALGLLADPTPAEREVYARYGRPDHFRAWWDPSGTVKQRIEILPRLKEVQKGKNLPPYSWIYLRQGVEVLFAGQSYEEQPLTDQIRILTRYGDPEDSKTLEGGVTQWMYFGAGKLYKFVRGQVVEEKEFPAMGNYIKP
jgi:hypothetical protein